jgi:hypothetical protein
MIAQAENPCQRICNFSGQQGLLCPDEPEAVGLLTRDEAGETCKVCPPPENILWGTQEFSGTADIHDQSPTREHFSAGGQGGTVSSIGLSALSQLSALSSNASQFFKDFKQLGADLSSGNLSAAQQDFVTLSQDAQAASQSSSATATSTTAATTAATTATAASTTGTSAQSKQSALASDFQTLSQDLQSGNLSGAQQAYSQIAKAVQGGGEHHHHHDHDGRSSGSSSIAQLLQSLLGNNSTSSTASTNSGSSTSSTGSSGSAGTSATSGTGSSTTAASSSPAGKLAQDFQAIGTALQSGNLSGAQQAFAQFSQDAQSAVSTSGVHPRAEDTGESARSELIQAFLASQSLSSTASNSSATSGSTLDVTA